MSRATTVPRLPADGLDAWSTITLNSSGSATTRTASSTTSTKNTTIWRRYGRANSTIRGIVPGASFFFVTSPLRVRERMAAHGLECIDTEVSPDDYSVTSGINAQQPVMLPATVRRDADSPPATGDQPPQNALIPVSARPISSFWIWEVPS